ncbi:hypothetical protein ACJJTC_011969 [Scirpophaga incertulas]
MGKIGVQEEKKRRYLQYQISSQTYDLVREIYAALDHYHFQAGWIGDAQNSASSLLKTTKTTLVNLVKLRKLVNEVKTTTSLQKQLGNRGSDKGELGVAPVKQQISVTCCLTGATHTYI